MNAEEILIKRITYLKELLKLIRSIFLNKNDQKYNCNSLSYIL